MLRGNPTSHRAFDATNKKNIRAPTTQRGPVSGRGRWHTVGAGPAASEYVQARMTVQMGPCRDFSQRQVGAVARWFPNQPVFFFRFGSGRGGSTPAARHPLRVREQKEQETWKGGRTMGGRGVPARLYTAGTRKPSFCVTWRSSRCANRARAGGWGGVHLSGRAAAAGCCRCATEPRAHTQTQPPTTGLPRGSAYKQIPRQWGTDGHSPRHDKRQPRTLARTQGVVCWLPFVCFLRCQQKEAKQAKDRALGGGTWVVVCEMEGRDTGGGGAVTRGRD